MLICLDYDKTYDAMPAIWDRFIDMLNKNGHAVVLATYRDDRYDRTPLLDDLAKTIPVFYTRGVAKKWWMQQFAPDHYANPDIWIDDRPEAILSNSGFDREGLQKWRTANDSRGDST